MFHENCNAHAGNRRKISSCNEVSKYSLKQLHLYFTPNWTATSSICMYFKTLGRRTVYEKIKIQGLGLQLINQENWLEL